MTPAFSPRIRATAEPPIPAARAWAARYQGQCGPVLDLTQAVPGYPPHPELLARLSAEAGSAARAGYGPINGEPALREALAADISGFYGADVGVEDVTITAGGNLGFAMVMAVLAGPSDRVLVPTPWYFNHQMALTMQGAEPVPLACRAEDGFLPDLAQVEAELTRGARALLLVSPNNPTGATYPAALILRCFELCRRHGAWLVVDETYRDFLPDSACPPHALFRDQAWREGFVQLYSFSKAYCVPGHRAGAVVAGPAVRAQLMKALDTWQICPPRPTQAALAWAVPALRAWRRANRDLMADRALACRAALAGLPGWRLEALGAYFAYLRLPEAAPDALAVAEYLATERGLSTLPGPFFGPGQARHLRLAFANASAEVLAALPARMAGLPW